MINYITYTALLKLHMDTKQPIPQHKHQEMDEVDLERVHFLWQ